MTVSAATTACGKQLKQRTHLLKNRLQTTGYGRMAVLGIRIWYVYPVSSTRHILTDNSRDDSDTDREIRNMFVRTNTLKRKFARCSSDVKLILFKSYCMNLYDSALWTHYCTGSFKLLQS